MFNQFFVEEIGQEILGNLSRDRETMTKTRDRVGKFYFLNWFFKFFYKSNIPFQLQHVFFFTEKIQSRENISWITFLV